MHALPENKGTQMKEYSYPPMEMNIEDDEHGDPRMGIEIFDVGITVR